MEKNIDLTKYGYTPVIDDFNLMPARVTAVQRDRFELITEKGFTFGRLKSSIYYGNSIREDDSKGRHTTTHRQMLFLDNDVMIIDTPGMRELGMWNVTKLSKITKRK